MSTTSQPSPSTEKKKHVTNIKKMDTFIYRTLYTVHPDSGLTGDSLSVINNLINITLQRIVSIINLLMINSERKTISSREVEYAVRLCFPGELCTLALSNAKKAIEKYKLSREKAQPSQPPSVAASPSRSKLAGLFFPVARIQTLMLQYATAKRKSDTAAVTLTACLEYVITEILDGAGNIAVKLKKKRIVPRHISLCIRDDAELDRLFNTTVLSGGVAVSVQVRKEKSKEKTEKPKKKVKKNKK